MGVQDIHKRFPATVWLAVAAAVLFNNWLLGFLLNRRLILAGGSVSELSVSSQPSHWVFRLLDIISGCLFILIAILNWRSMKISRIILAVVLVLGVSNIVDALSPLPCSGTLDYSCSAAVNLSWRHFSIPSHAYSSTVIGICYLALPILGMFEARKLVNRFLQFLSLALLAATLIFFGLLLNESLKGRYVGSSAAGFSQVIQMIVLGFWLIYYFAAEWLSEKSLAKT